MNPSPSGQISVRRRTRQFVYVFAWLALACTNCRTHPRASLDSTPSAQLPPVMIWAWEQPARLNFLDAREAGVAYLAATIGLQRGDVVITPRMQRLEVSRAVQLLAVVRIEPERRDGLPSYDDAQRARIVTEIVALQDLPQVCGVQIDFDAHVSEREFYRLLLNDLRRALPPGKALTMTALASWCAGDNKWLDDLPVDEAVPMLFRMGADTGAVLARLNDGRDFSSALCRQSYGVAIDESVSLPAFLRSRRRYVFNGKAWTQSSIDKALNGVQP